MAWILLVVAGLLEVVWAYTMKLSDGFTRLNYSSITIVAMIASFGLLSVAMKSLPPGHGLHDLDRHRRRRCLCRRHLCIG